MSKKITSKFRKIFKLGKSFYTIFARHVPLAQLCSLFNFHKIGWLINTYENRIRKIIGAPDIMEKLLDFTLFVKLFGKLSAKSHSQLVD